MEEPNTFFKDALDPKLDQIKKDLEGNSVTSKLEAMKRLIAMISKGRDVRSLFPNVVKNVVCDNNQVKRLVYMYLIHYAEFEQDLALLSINTFQKDLDNPSPFIRSQALRVLSSIRLKVITHILIISIQRCMVDSSPYVRKTAAHAIPKVFSLDHEKKEELIDCIETLMGDNTTLVLGSAIAAFSEVCPERIDLLHPHFRKFCNMLADIDEWGQISVVNILTRYARTQFGNPNPNEDTKSDKPRKKKKASSFYSDEESEDDDLYDDNYDDGFEIDPDHRLLLRAVGPLLQSRNNGVVVAVSMLLYYCAPAAEALKIGKPLVRIVRSPPQISYLVLCNIVTMSRKRPEMFTPYLAEFFVYDTDPGYIRDLKLEILTNIATESNISKILRELSHYVRTDKKEFVTATIQAIGTVAARLPEVQETCLQRLISLLSSRSEIVVAESVIVIKKLLQLGAGTDTRIVTHLAKLLDDIHVPNARASVIWIVGEYNQHIPLYAPDILRKLSISFKSEDKIVKLQILTLATKLLLQSPNDETLGLLFQYIVNMAKFDMNYDLRDRARVLRVVIATSKAPTLKQNAATLICSEKPAPDVANISHPDTFALGSLSHIVNHTAFGYQPLGDWPDEIPDPSVRNQAPRKQRTMYGMPGAPATNKGTTSYGGDEGEGGFYSEDSEFEDYTDSYEDSEDDFYGDSKPKSSSKSASKSASKPSNSSSNDAFFGFGGSSAPAPKQKKKDSFFDDDDSFDDFSDDEDDTPAPKSSSNNDPFAGFGNTSAKSSAPAAKAAPKQDLLNTDLLGLSFDSPSNSEPASPSLPLMGSPIMGSTPNSSAARVEAKRDKSVLLKKVVGNGLQVEYLFLRRTSIEGPGYCPIELTYSNTTLDTLQNIQIKGEGVASSDAINVLPPNSQATGLINVKFSSQTTPIKLTISHSTKSFNAELQPQAGELITQSGAISESEFATTQKKLGGMQEVSGKFQISNSETIPERVVSVANVVILHTDVSNGIFHFAGRTILDDQTLLVSVEVREGFARLKVNCGNAIFGNTLHRGLKKVLEKK